MRKRLTNALGHRLVIVLVGIALGLICREIFPPATSPAEEPEPPKLELRSRP